MDYRKYTTPNQHGWDKLELIVKNLTGNPIVLPGPLESAAWEGKKSD